MIKWLINNVLPGVAEVLASFLLFVSMLIRLDLPTLERPIKAYSGFVSLGHILTMGALRENSAVLMFIVFCFYSLQRYKKGSIMPNFLTHFSSLRGGGK
jgi:hypothetical protein